MNEQWQCLSCWHSGAMDLHGRCEACGSGSLISDMKSLALCVPRNPASRLPAQRKEIA